MTKDDEHSENGPATSTQSLTTLDARSQSSEGPDGGQSFVSRGTVVLAATPIGNVGDASARLISLLEHADIVAAEDTRRLYDLANRLGVRVGGRVVAYHDHNERGKADPLLDQVEAGACVLVVSDAGMPTINDPGLAIVRRAIERGLPVTCAPGPSAALDALALSGLPTDRFCYEGFLPRKGSERRQHLRSLRFEPRTMIFYETPHRIDGAMQDLLDEFGPDRAMALCRELTKDHEQVRRGTVGSILASFQEDPPRGEMVLVVAGADPALLNSVIHKGQEEGGDAGPAGAEGDGSLPGSSIPTYRQLAVLSRQRSKAEGVRLKDAIAEVVKEHPLPDGSLPKRKQVYSAALGLD